MTAIMVEGGRGAGRLGVAGRGSRETGVKSSHWLKLKYVPAMRTSDKNKNKPLSPGSSAEKVGATPPPSLDYMTSPWYVVR